MVLFFSGVVHCTLPAPLCLHVAYRFVEFVQRGSVDPVSALVGLGITCYKLLKVGVVYCGSAQNSPSIDSGIK